MITRPMVARPSMDAPARPIIEIESAGMSFAATSGAQAGRFVALRDIHLRVAPGESVTLIGHSGCGKSTLLNLLAGLHLPTEGVVVCNGREVAGPGPDRAVVFQNHSLLPWLSCHGNVMLAVEQVFGATEGRAQLARRVEATLAMVRMGHAAHKRPNEISGGMKQRVGIARALAMQPRVLLMDEPFGALDALTRAHLQDELMRIVAESGSTVVMVTHDVDEAVLLSDRIVMMTNGPAATIGEIVEVALPRPRDRVALAEDPLWLRCRHRVLADDGTVEHYDRLLLATGSTPFMPPIEGIGLPGVVGYRDIADTRAMIEAAAGIRPGTALAERIGLRVDRGIVVNDTLQTFDPRIYAVGECVSHRGVAYGLVAPLFDMAKVAANHLARLGIGRYEGSVTSTKLKVTGCDLFSAGEFMGGEGCEELVLSDPAGGVYRKLVVRGDRLVGACLYGDTVDGAWYFKLMRSGQSISGIRDRLMFGESNLGDAGHQGQDKAAAMPDEAEVCGCNGVSKGAIVRAIKTKGLFTIEQVRKYTKASGSCGSCTGLVEQILMNTVGSDHSAAPAARPMCECTTHSHGDVRDAIRKLHLTGIEQTMRVLDWKTADGCTRCRPALNYYLTSTWPREAKDDTRSRLVNERNHANIQRDGTYSVVPRMWGGETSASELRRIADVVEKYAIPTVKITGGQRIDLLGVRREDLPDVWKDLDMPSGHAYAKALRTVKTCVGSEWCRFGTQDSTSLGKALERALWKMYAPHKVKLAVSGCPRNCAECGIKDVGVIGVDSGWEIYVAGNGGIRTEVAQFFVKVDSAEEVLEYAGAFLQLYREEGHYLERTAHYVARVGLDSVRRRVVDDAAQRRALWERLQYALADQVDPWHEPSKAGVDSRQYETLEG